MRGNTTKIETHANTCYKVVSNTCRGEDGEAPLLVRGKWSQKSRRGHDLTRSNTIPQSPVTSHQEEAHCVNTQARTGPSCSSSANNQARVPSAD